ncbi:MULTISPECIES: hypothetical protein [Mycobacterium ulcerans group]|uniref:hypothetical protein n=1 Tax=Mycobacterium ulcerans group TaxID=2993898 RepID=UPI0006804CE7|nr:MULTISPECIES: hypothetical protein [Mycobacterium ulcerans group]WOR04716.1 hypothetical protein QDR78_00155 [Mycobacterium marinum]
MGPDELQVVLGQVGVTAGQWHGLGAQLAAGTTPPAFGPPFRATTAAVSGINAAIGGAAAAFVGRTQATAAGEMAAVTQVTVV